MLHCATVLKQHQCKARTYLNFIYLRSVTHHQKSNDAQHGLNQLTGGRGFAGARCRVSSTECVFVISSVFTTNFYLEVSHLVPVILAHANQSRVKFCSIGVQCQCRGELACLDVQDSRLFLPFVQQLMSALRNHDHIMYMSLSQVF